MHIKRPANDTGPCGPHSHVFPVGNVRFNRDDAPPKPCNDPGLPPAIRAGEATVLLACTGITDDGLCLDVVLETGRASVLLASKICEREAIAEARRIGALHGARLVMLSLSGHRVALEPAPVPAARRQGSPLSGRRPRFLARRQPGFDPQIVGESTASERNGQAERAEQAAGHQPGKKQEAGVAI
jgi:hypothetical protein